MPTDTHTTRDVDNPYRAYWRFYWPLSLIGVAMLAGRFAQNYVLLDAESGVRELALFALAFGVFHPFDAALILAPQMANVLAQCRDSLRTSLISIVAFCLLLTVPVVILGWTSLGRVVVPLVYEIDEAGVERVLLYLRWFAPLIVMGGLARYLNGLLVQARRTGMTAMLLVVALVVLVGVMALGIRLGWQLHVTICLSRLISEGVYLLASAVLTWRYHAVPEGESKRSLSYGQALAFFLPMALTTVMFSISRPIIFSFITSLNPDGDPKLPDVEAIIAAVSLGFSFAMVFCGMVNAFRHLMVTFGGGDLESARRFMTAITVGVVGLMFATAASPVSLFFFGTLQGAEGITLVMARDAFFIQCLAPLAMAWRNYYHGLAMIHRHTVSMGVGGLMRNASIWLCAWALLRLGGYNHITAGGMIVVGFCAEAVTVIVASRRWRRRL